MDDFYGQQFGGHGFQGSQQSGNDHGMDLDGFGGSSMFSGQSIPKTEGERRSVRFSTMPNQGGQGMDIDQSGMLHFNGDSSNSGQLQDQPLNNFQFSASPQGPLMPAGSIFGADGSGHQQLLGQQHGQSLNLVTQNMNSNPSYSNVMSSTPTYQSPLEQSQQMNMAMAGQFMPQGMQMGLGYSDQDIQNMLNNGTGDFNLMQQQNQFPTQVMVSPSAQNFSQQRSNSGQSSGDGSRADRRHSMQDIQRSNSYQVEHARRQSQGMGLPSNVRRQSTSGFDQIVPSQADMTQAQNMQQISNQVNESMRQGSDQWPKRSQGFPTSMPVRPGQHSNFQNAYSSTGFDMMNVLMKVATRKHPEINIGAVDLSCAFVVCDASEHDAPIVYCSENFERLTGYTKHEILGRNCRFLQAPDGKVQAGIKRGYVDDDSVLYLKNAINGRREAQVSLINYRKGGQPFMNLLTIIPISYDNNDVKFFVGFQVDLVEQPNSVTSKNPDGSYTINYQRGLAMPRYVFDPTEKQAPALESGQTVPRDEVTTVLSTIGNGESELSMRIWDKVLLENTDDVVFVLSLKGLFLYLSPSANKVLEYESSELTGTALSSICHPSDIVPVTRELKDTASTNPVNVVFRIRRKHNGYMWFEGLGSLHTEQGKGRKSIVLVGRERPVYTLSKKELLSSGGIGDNELWSKLSTSGTFLFVASNVRQLLDKHPDELVGTSIQASMRPESRSDFSRILEIAKTGKKAATKHELLNKRGQVLQAFSTIYPGDAIEGHKPSFIIAQTRLVKYSRPSGSNSRTTSFTKLPHKSESPMTTSSASGMMNSAGSLGGFESPARFMGTVEGPTTTAGQHGLQLGHQDIALASEENLFDELKTTRSTSWQFELRQMEKQNRLLAEELQGLLAARKKRKRRKGNGQLEKDCANCHTRVTPEWRRGPSGNRDLCNSCGLRWAKQQGRISPRTSSQRSQPSQHSASDNPSASPRSAVHNSPSAEYHTAPTASSAQVKPKVEEDRSETPVPKSATKPTSPRRHSGDPSTGHAVPNKIEEIIDEVDSS